MHVLNTIRELDRVFTQAEPITLKYRTALHETTDPDLLYLILLLHDIGKAEGIRGHAESGVRIAGPDHGPAGHPAADAKGGFICHQKSPDHGTILAEA